jgi:alpha-tubulin suppressor-like RCC1 family protein
VVAIAAGGNHNLALCSDGTLVAWGLNYYGQLGDGTTVEQPRPRQIPGLSGVKSLAASRSSSYAVKTDGTVVAWGANDLGQLGDGTTTERTAPMAVVGLFDVVEIAAGQQHVLTRKNDGTVWGWSWGDNAGELGNTPGEMPPKAAQIAALSGIGSIAAGDSTSAFIRDDGQVLMGGRNYIGQQGDGTFTVRSDLGLVVNSNADGFLNLGSGAPGKVAAALAVPFYVTASGGVSDKRASVATTTKFNPVD